VPTYNVYFTDTWHAKPTFTLMYGLGYQIEMPPYEINGEQITLVDQNDVPITVQQYLSETTKPASRTDLQPHHRFCDGRERCGE